MLEYDTSWLGKEFDRYTYNVTKEEIVEFAQSIGETNPLYIDEAMPEQRPMVASLPANVLHRLPEMPDCLISLSYGVALMAARSTAPAPIALGMPYHRGRPHCAGLRRRDAAT